MPNVGGQHLSSRQGSLWADAFSTKRLRATYSQMASSKQEEGVQGGEPEVQGCQGLPSPALLPELCSVRKTEGGKF